MAGDLEDNTCDEQQKLEDVFVAVEEQLIEKVAAGEMSQDEFSNVLQTHHQLLLANVVAKHSLVSQSCDDEHSSRMGMSLSSSVVLVPSDVEGGDSFAAAVSRLSSLVTETPTTEASDINKEDTKMAVSAVQAAITAWDAKPQRRGPLTDLVSTGAIPRQCMLSAWCRLTGAELARTGGLSLSQLVDIADGKSESNDVAVNLDAQVKHRIRKDLHRTCCNEEFTSSLDQSEDGELYQILAAYVAIDSSVSYVQGMNYIAAMCLTASHHAGKNEQADQSDDIEDIEDIAGKRKKIAAVGTEAAFLLFVRLMQGTGLRRLYDRNDDHLHELILRLDWHIRGCLPTLHAHLESEDVGATLFAVEWLTTLFVYNVSYDNSAIIFGLIMVEGGLGFIVQLGVALLAYLEQELLSQRFDTLLIWLKQRLKTLTAAELLAASRQLGRRVRHIKDYTTTPIATAGTAADMTAAVGDEEVGGLGSLGGRNFQGFVAGGLGGGHALGGLGDLGGTLLTGLQGDSREAWRRLRRPRWMPDEEVRQCHSPSCSRRFSALSQRKHHCRSCGCVFCGPCALTRSPLPHLGYIESVRVCDFCAASGALVSAQQATLAPNSTIHQRFVFSCDMPSRSTSELEGLRLKKELVDVEGVSSPKSNRDDGLAVLSPIKQWMGQKHDIAASMTASVSASSAQWLNRLRMPARELNGDDDDDDDDMFNEVVDDGMFNDEGDLVHRSVSLGAARGITATIHPPLPPPSPPPSDVSDDPSIPAYVAPPPVRPPPPPPPQKIPPPLGTRPPPPPTPSSHSRTSVSSSPEDLDLFLTTAVGSCLISSSPTPAPFFPQTQPTDLDLFSESHSAELDLFSSSDVATLNDEDDFDSDLGLDSDDAPWRRSVMYDGQPASSLFDIDADDDEKC